MTMFLTKYSPVLESDTLGTPGQGASEAHFVAKLSLALSSHFVCFGCKDAMKIWCRISEFALTTENRENKCVELAPT